MRKIGLYVLVAVLFVTIIFVSAMAYSISESDIFFYIIIAAFLVFAFVANMIVFMPHRYTERDEADNIKITRKNIARMFFLYYIFTFFVVFIVVAFWNYLFESVVMNPHNLFGFMQLAAIYSIPVSIIILLGSIFSGSK